MGMDTECDLTLEARGDARVAAVIRSFRDQLVGEHSGTTPEHVAEVEKAAGSLSAAIEKMGTPKRKPGMCAAPQRPGAKLVVAKVGDPDAPLELEKIVEQVAPEAASS